MYTKGPCSKAFPLMRTDRRWFHPLSSTHPPFTQGTSPVGPLMEGRRNSLTWILLTLEHTHRRHPSPTLLLPLQFKPSLSLSLYLSLLFPRRIQTQPPRSHEDRPSPCKLLVLLPMQRHCERHCDRHCQSNLGPDSPPLGLIQEVYDMSPQKMPQMRL